MLKLLQGLFGKVITYSYIIRDCSHHHTKEIVGFSSDLNYVYFKSDDEDLLFSGPLSSYTSFSDILHNQDDESIKVTRSYVMDLVVIEGEVIDSFKSIQCKLLKREVDSMIRKIKDLLEEVDRYKGYIKDVTDKKEIKSCLK